MKDGLVDLFGQLLRALFEGILPLYRNTDFAYAIAGIMTLTAFLVILVGCVSYALQTAVVGKLISAVPASLTLTTHDPNQNAYEMVLKMISKPSTAQWFAPPRLPANFQIAGWL